MRVRSNASKHVHDLLGRLQLVPSSGCSGAVSGAAEHTRGGGPSPGPVRARTVVSGRSVAASVQFCWPPAFRFLTVCVQVLVAADAGPCPGPGDKLALLRSSTSARLGCRGGHPELRKQLDGVGVEMRHGHPLIVIGFPDPQRSAAQPTAPSLASSRPSAGIAGPCGSPGRLPPGPCDGLQLPLTPVPTARRETGLSERRRLRGEGHPVRRVGLRPLRRGTLGRAEHHRSEYFSTDVCQLITFDAVPATGRSS